MIGTPNMHSVTVTEAKARLSQLLDEVANGGTVEVTRGGKPLARIVPVERERRSIDFDALRKFRSSLTSTPQATSDSIAERKADERY
jgi:prevent-host-death family protein